MTPEDREPARAKIALVCCVINLLLGGCGEMLTKWECQTGVCRPATPALNKFIASVTAANPPVSPGRKHVRILYAAQIGVAPPSFVLFSNVATEFHFSYERFLINQIREQFRLVGTPIRIQVRRRKKK